MNQRSALTLAMGFKALAWATGVAEILVFFGVLSEFSGSGEGGTGGELTATSLGFLVLGIVAMVILPCLLAGIGYGLEALVGIFDRSDPAKFVARVRFDPPPPSRISRDDWVAQPISSSSAPEGARRTIGGFGA